MNSKQHLANVTVLLNGVCLINVISLFFFILTAIFQVKLG